jgi:hypothetical protein
VDDSDGDGNFTVGWSTVDRAVLYILEEDRDTAFAEPVEAYRGGKTWIDIAGRSDGQYCYRVKAANSYGSSPWSNTSCRLVPTATPETVLATATQEAVLPTSTDGAPPTSTHDIPAPTITGTGPKPTAPPP